MRDKPYNPYARRIPRGARKVMLVLLSDASNMSGYPISRAAGVGSGTVYITLNRLEELGWVAGDWEKRDDDRPRRRFYRLTSEGRAEVMSLLGLIR